MLHKVTKEDLDKVLSHLGGLASLNESTSSTVSVNDIKENNDSTPRGSKQESLVMRILHSPLATLLRTHSISSKGPQSETGSNQNANPSKLDSDHKNAA